LLEARAGGDAALVAELSALINAVYAVAEAGLWRAGARRTTPVELAELIRERQIAVAWRDGRAVGCVQVYDVAHDTGGFGMLVADPGERNSGVGRALIGFVEQQGRERGLRVIRLELLVPRGWSHPSKEFLRAWYGRCGYELVHTGRLGDDYPHLEPLLATECDLEIHEKVL
jgi:GNAT superfamily N-acetyltransferase